MGGAGVAVTRGRTSAITLGSPVRTSTVPMSHFLFPHFKYGAVSIMRYKLGVRRENTLAKAEGHHRRL